LSTSNGSNPGDSSGTHVDFGEPTIEFKPDSDNPADLEATIIGVSPSQTVPDRNLQEAQFRATGQFIGRFEIRQRLGQGSYGVVYRAYDPVLDRDVALKVPRFVSSDPSEIEYFFREAKAASRLRHPNIVAVFESGRAEGDYYIATEFVEGEPLADHIAKGRPSIGSAVEWVRELADATAYAHSEGIVHRDIKPGNIMIGRSGRPQLMDFGLAKRQTGQDDTSDEGIVIGTPSYMSPEQARGDVHLTGPLSDQYTLGVVLYELLTGRKPYTGQTHSVVTRVSDLHVSPPSPRSIDPSISRDLEACCLKAMEKSPERRYADAHEFATDLRRWLAGTPVHARPISNAERLWRWCLRNRAVASLAAIVALLLIGGSITATVAAFRFRNLAERERIAAKNAEAALVDMYTNSGLVASELGDPAQAVLWFATAAWQARDDRPRRDANRIRVRNWCRQVPLPVAALPHTERVKEFFFHPGGRYVMTLAYSRKCIVWDLETARPIELPAEIQEASAVAWSPNGQWLAVGTNDRIVLSSFPEGQERQEVPHTGSLLALEFSGDGRYLAIGGDAARVWNLETHEFASPPLVHPQPVARLVFNTRGDRLVTACQDAQVRVFAVGGDEPKTEPLYSPLPHLGRFGNPVDQLRPLLVGDDRGLITLSATREITWWNSETGEQLRLIPTEQAVLNLTRSADGQRFIACCFKTALLWDVASGEAVDDSILHANFIYSAAFSRDGREVVTASADRRVGLWNSETGDPLGQMLAHQAEVDLVAFAPDGERFAAVQIDGLVRVWELPHKESSFVQQVAIPANESYVTISPDGQLMTPSGWNHGRDLRTVQFYDVATGKPQPMAVTPAGVVNKVALSPDGTRFVTLSSLPANARRPPNPSLLSNEPGVVEIWNRQTGKRTIEPLQTPSEPMGAAWSPDGKSLVVICGNGQILVIDSESGTTRHECDQGASVLLAYMVRDWIGMAPDGRTFATWGMGSLVRVWETSTGRLLYERKHDQPCHDVRFSRDGDLLASMSMDGTATVGQSQTGEVLARLPHPDWVFTAAFSRDGRWLLTACRDRMARLWDWKRGVLICPAMEHKDEVFGVAFADDERAILTCCRDHSAQFWDSFTGKPVARPIKLPGPVFQVATTPPESRYAVYAGRTPSLSVVRLQDVFKPVAEQIDAEQLRTLSEITAGQRVHERGGVVNLTTREWLDRWESFHKQHPHFSEHFR
jgi:WD40 repeat protein